MTDSPFRDELAQVAGYKTFDEAPEELCCVCSPVYFDNAGNYDFNPPVRHQWHNSFEQKFFKKGTLFTDHQGNIARRDGKKFNWDEGSEVEIDEQDNGSDQQRDV